MRPSIVLRYAGSILLLNSVFMLVAMILSTANESDTAFYPLLLSFFITATVGIFPLLFVPADNYISIKEVYAIVVVSWLVICSFGILPYLLWGGEFNFVNAWFESVSGYTTTGATILTNVEELPQSLLFFRSCTHWMGGVGVILFALLVAPALKMNKMKLSKIEMSSLTKDNFMYKTHETIRVILSVYITSTLLCFLLLQLAGMNWFDALNHAFSTVATGGFSTKNMSIAAFDNPWVGIIITFFMLLSGLHFGMVYGAVTGRSTVLFRSPIVRYYFASVGVGMLLVTLNLWLTDTFPNFGESMLHASFQVASMTTTTGFATSNSAYWPSFSILVLMFFMLQTACAGSTVGGMKVDRIFMFFKALKVQIKKQQHPNAILHIKIGNTSIDEDISYSVIIFMLFFMLIAFIATMLLSLMNIDMISAFSASLASISNVGAAFGLFGSLDNYNSLNAVGKILLTILMFIGRLEIYGLLMLFFIRSWK